MSDWLNGALVSLIQFVIGKCFIAAGRALRNGSTNMDVLVAVGTTALMFILLCFLYGALDFGLQLTLKQVLCSYICCWASIWSALPRKDI